MNDIRNCIIVDSSSSIINNQIKDVYMTPLTIIEITNDKENIYEDIIQINSSQVIEKIQNNIELKTSQTSLGQMIEIMNKLKDKYDRFYIIPISSDLSGSYNTWKIAIEEYKDKEIHLIDCKDIGIGIKSIVEYLVESFGQNRTPEEILKFIEQRKKRRYATLVITDVTQLKKGGRISSLKSWVINKFKLNIIITFNGALDFYDKAKSLDKTIEICLQKINEETNFKDKGIKKAYFYTTFLDEKENNKIKSEIDKKLNFVSNQEFLPSSISVHTGPNAFAIYIEAN